MPRILGIDIPGKKRIEYSLRYIYGIGLSRAQRIVQKAKIDPAKRADDLTGDEITRITAMLQEGYLLEGDLRREVAQNIRRLISIGSYRGLRHRKGLPVRGQRTHTNARTRKGVRKTVGVVRGKEARAAVKTDVGKSEAKA
jgi:small subunit ribosomal protein S13